MYASEDADRRPPRESANDPLQRALDKVAEAEATLARARGELQAVQQSELGWNDGLAGRRRVADELAALAPLGWTFLDAVHWPGRPGVVIDHVGAGPGGVVVMFSRQWAGVVDVHGGVLRQDGIPRLREVSAVSAAAGAVCALLQPDVRTAVSAFVCGVQYEVVPATVAPGVNVVGVGDVAAVVAGLSPRLDPAQVGAVLDRLRGVLVGPDAPEQLTTRALTVYGAAAAGPSDPSAPTDPSAPHASSQPAAPPVPVPVVAPSPAPPGLAAGRHRTPRRRRPRVAYRAARPAARPPAPPAEWPAEWPGARPAVLPVGRPALHRAPRVRGPWLRWWLPAALGGAVAAALALLAVVRP